MIVADYLKNQWAYSGYVTKAIVVVLKNRWACSGYVTKAAVVVSTIPLAVWGTSMLEATLLCALRALTTPLSSDAQTRSDRWKLTKFHFWDGVATGTLFLVSLLPLYGTYKSYRVIIQMATNHVSNKWLLRELQQKQDLQRADGLYRELLAWEPDVEQLIRFATDKAPPTQAELDDTSKNLRGTLVGRSVVYSSLFHLIKGGCRAAKICAIRIVRLIKVVFKTLFSGRLLRFFIHTAQVIRKAAIQEAVYSRDLAGQPDRINVPKVPIRELYRDEIFLTLEACESEQERTQLREGWAKISKLYRQYAVDNDLTRISSDPYLPEGAPVDYFHKRGFLPRACGCPKATSADYILKETYFKPIFPYLDHFDMKWLKTMPPKEKQKLMWGLSTQLPSLHTLNLDMAGIDPRWQLLIAIQFAKHAASLGHVTVANADPRAVDILRRFCDWRCTVN